MRTDAADWRPAMQVRISRRGSKPRAVVVAPALRRLLQARRPGRSRLAPGARANARRHAMRRDSWCVRALPSVVITLPPFGLPAGRAEHSECARSGPGEPTRGRAQRVVTIAEGAPKVRTPAVPVIGAVEVCWRRCTGHHQHGRDFGGKRAAALPSPHTCTHTASGRQRPPQVTTLQLARIVCTHDPQQQSHATLHSRTAPGRRHG